MTNTTEATPTAMTNATKGKNTMSRKTKKRRHADPPVVANDVRSEAPGALVAMAGKAKANRAEMRAASREAPNVSSVTTNAIVGWAA
ncbi:MAG: hypothetical protein HC869_10820 [Rhodospirillales bacterium]|nr:hypothetical protein [Rhodospirillales bacterium]